MRRLINELTKLPSIGERSAQRLAYHLLNQERQQGQQLAEAIRDALNKTKLCQVCFFLTENSLCTVCEDARRDRSLLCVVEKPADILALEKSGGYRGLYHVLHGLWSPLRGVQPEHTRIGELLQRVSGEVTGEGQGADPLERPVKEVILGTGNTVEGDATALYIANCLQESRIPITRLAQGLPKGGELEFADELTLHLSLENRKQV